MLLRNETLTPEARQRFGIRRSPFVDEIATRADVFQCPSMRMARAALMDCALNHGFLALVGESGAGKSTLREELEQRILDENRPVIVIKPRKTGKRNQAHSSATSAASASACRRTSASSSPSTMTRTSGSVPDLRSSTRPRPASAALTARASSSSL